MGQSKLNMALLLIVLFGINLQVSSKTNVTNNSFSPLVPIATRYQCFSTDDCQGFNINLNAVAESCNSPINLRWKYIIRNADTEEIIQYSYNYTPAPSEGKKAGNILDNLDETIEAKLHIIDALEIGTYRVSWTLIDHQNNISHKDHYFDIFDNEAPIADMIEYADYIDFQGELKAISFDRGLTFNGALSSNDDCSDNLLFTYTPFLPNLSEEPIEWLKQYTKYGKYFFNPQNGEISNEEAYLDGTADAWHPQQNTSERTINGFCNSNIDCSNEVEQKIYVWDQFAINDDCNDNNFSHSEVSLYFDCECFNNKISGYVTGHQSDLPLNNMIILVDDGMISQFTKTDTNGYYELDLRRNEYLIEAFKESDYINGVTTLDIIHIQKYLLGIKDIIDPYRLLSADVNWDQKISASDILDIRKLILGVTDTLRYKSWLGIPKNYEYDDPKEAFKDIENFPIYKISNFEGEQEFNFSAIKIGDLNYSADLIASRNFDYKSFVIEDKEIEMGDFITIPFYASDFEDIFGFQFRLNFKNLEIAKVTSEALPLDSSKYYVNGNNLTVSWTNPKGFTIPDNEVLFSISFNSNTSDNLSNLLRIIPEEFNQEIYFDSGLNINHLELKYRDYPNNNKFNLEQNIPNPFSENTKINFTLQEDSEYTLLLYDLTGKLIHEFIGVGKKGENTFNLNRVNCLNDFMSHDVQAKTLIYKLKSNNNVSHKKMIWLNTNRF